ncbi:type IV pilus assembly protein PilM [Planosporangium flavigriseum]|uniref:Fimbrial assembly protein n=1 Tax=Planosporangium flavigriseum TaxID=373681 RepID=A0A8J3PN17_9ACTN|nr:type IV pilus assembly protein PilM [Planosporangium flavigriseum]NJC67211.1 type IV pilus assembly protein PilM [Planosporangium flavigriseum]GIG76141.1 fimbrial assembly protein [Planosporangium flavigriseum]
MAAVSHIGLDIGSTSIRAVEAARGKDGPVVTNFGQAALPPGAVKGGVVGDDRALTLALKQLWSASRFRSRKVVLGVTNPQIVVRETTLANLPEREMRKALPFQVRDSLPLPVERSLLDFHPLEAPNRGETVRGLLIAAPKEAVLTMVRATERAGLHVTRVDLPSFALLRAASRTDGRVEALVDIGAHTTTVVVHLDGEPLIVRTIPRGGAEVTDVLAGRLGVAAPEAEALKCQVGLRADADARIAGMIREAAGPVFDEIRNSFAYLNAGGRQAQVARLALSGGGCLLPGLAEALGAHLGVETVIADPTVRLSGWRRSRTEAPDSSRPATAVSVGLALGAA